MSKSEWIQDSEYKNTWSYTIETDKDKLFFTLESLSQTYYKLWISWSSIRYVHDRTVVSTTIEADSLEDAQHFVAFIAFETYLNRQLEDYYILRNMFRLDVIHNGEIKDTY